MTTELEQLKDELGTLAFKIKALEVKQQECRHINYQADLTLNTGEKYAGVILGEDGMPSHHLILMDGEAEAVSWADAQAWAEAAGGTLPTRREQALLFANLKGEFSENWYWSSAAAGAGSAWYQDFDNGHQNDYDTGDKFRARAVRRVDVKK